MLRHDPMVGWVFGGERLELSTKVFNTIKSLITVLMMLIYYRLKRRNNKYW